MIMSKAIVVFGIGRFGKSLALEMYKSGADVMAVDKDEDLIESMSHEVTYAAVADLTNAEAIKSLGIDKMDIAVIAIGSDLTASIMCVMVAKEQGVPYVVAKAANDRMGLILTKVGADKIIYPEKETGIRTARTLLSNNFLEFFNIDDNLCLIEMKPKKEWIGKTLRELNLREKYHINVVAVKDHNEMRSHIDPNRALDETSDLLIIAERDDLKKIS